jgi:hypothetical protein
MFKLAECACLLLAFGMILPLDLFAADPSDSSWEDLRQLGAGQQIQVVEMNLRSQEGTFFQLSEEAISFRVEDRAVSVPRAEVFKVSLRGGRKRLRNVLLGLLVGGGMGLAVGAAQDRNHCGDPSSDYCYHKLAGGVIGLGFGAAGGAVIPVGPRILYRATPPQRGRK